MLRLRVAETTQELRLGAGVRGELPSVLEELGVRRPLLLSSRSSAGLAAQLTEGLEGARALAWARAHVPAALAEETAAAASEHAADGLVSVGGGAATGLAKAVALQTGLPIVAVPTTLAGSEATPVWGRTEDGRKRTGRDPTVKPRVVLADPELLVDVPGEVLAASGINAMAHTSAAYTGAAASPLSRLLAADGARRLLAGLVGAVAHELDALAEALYGAQLTARGLALAGSGPHHRICHALGGAFDLPHAGTHAALLPHTLAALEPDVRAELREDLGAGEPAAAVADLARAVGAPTALLDQGLPAGDLDRAIELACHAAGDDMPAERVTEVVRAAHAGDRPPRVMPRERAKPDRAIGPPSPPEPAVGRSARGGQGRGQVL